MSITSTTRINSNLRAKGYENLIKKVAIGTTKAFEWVIFTNEKYLQNMVKVDLEIQFKTSVMKRKFENQKHKA